MSGAASYGGCFRLVFLGPRLFFLPCLPLLVLCGFLVSLPAGCLWYFPGVWTGCLTLASPMSASKRHAGPQVSLRVALLVALLARVPTFVYIECVAACRAVQNANFNLVLWCACAPVRFLYHVVFIRGQYVFLINLEWRFM